MANQEMVMKGFLPTLRFRDGRDGRDGGPGPRGPAGLTEKRG